MYANYFKLKKFVRRPSGLTLVELMVVIAMLGILMGMAFALLNPKHQLSKVDDARRKQDIKQLKTALDTYYNDHNCYPTILPFGSAWDENGTTYMRKVPQDLACAGNANCYVYKYLGTCSQWNVVFTKLAVAPTTPQCSLTGLSACVPTDYDSSWACVVSGTVDSAGCAHLASSSLGSGSDSSAPPTGTPLPPNSPTPTPQGCSRDYACSLGTCNHVTSGSGDYCTSSCNGMCSGR